MLNTFYVERKRDDLRELKENFDPIPGLSANQSFSFVKTIQVPEKRKKRRILLRKGAEYFSVPMEHIALFYTANKIAYAIDQFGKRYMTEGHLAQLENELDQDIFFRANRQFIINLNHVRSFKAYEKVKLKIDLFPCDLNKDFIIIISQERASYFRKWISAA